MLVFVARGIYNLAPVAVRMLSFFSLYPTLISSTLPVSLSFTIFLFHYFPYSHITFPGLQDSPLLPFRACNRFSPTLFLDADLINYL